MMKALIDRYKKIRKKELFKQKFKSNYAFVGVGNHSINNLYPVLNYLNVNLKHIVVKNEDTVEMVKHHFTNSLVSTDLEKVLNDSDINGVFVSITPSVHFQLAKKVISANKNLFIEKPPCLTLGELNELIALEDKHKKTVLVGVQRRYSPVYNILQNKVKNASYYTLKFKTGAYPEGDELIDLFIHPLDALFYLFGDGNVTYANKVTGNGVVTYLAQIKHENGIVGSLEFSTDYSWNEAIDTLIINTPKVNTLQKIQLN